MLEKTEFICKFALELKTIFTFFSFSDMLTSLSLQFLYRNENERAFLDIHDVLHSVNITASNSEIDYP